jgi:hypothetical protein
VETAVDGITVNKDGVALCCIGDWFIYSYFFVEGAYQDDVAARAKYLNSCIQNEGLCQN